MKWEVIMKVLVATLVVVLLGACCVIGGPLPDGPEIELKVAARWNEQTPPTGSSAIVDFYVMLEGTGNWTILLLDVPYPEDGGVLLDTMRLDYEVPLNGDHVTYRYEIDLTVGGVIYTAADYPEDLACESGKWWWHFGGKIYCSEGPR